MRIGVIARELEQSRRGVARWLGEVLAAWQRAGLSQHLTLFVENGLPDDIQVGQAEIVTTGPGPGAGATSWEQIALLRALARRPLGALLGPAYSAPLLTRVPTVVVLHDLSFEAHPEWFSLREGARRRFLGRLAARRAAALIAPSRFTADEIAERYRPRAPIAVIGNGVADHFRPVHDGARLAATRQRLGLAAEFVLTVGSIFQRRHVPDLVRGFSSVCQQRPGLQLVIVGDNRTHPHIDIEQLIARAGIASNVRWLQSVTDPELVDLYNMASVSVYLSQYEGFGIPPLEALACGSPVLASASPALGETLTGHAALLPMAHHVPDRIAAALLDLVQRPPAARERPAWLDRFSWQATAAATWDCLLQAQRRDDRGRDDRGRP